MLSRRLLTSALRAAQPVAVASRSELAAAAVVAVERPARAAGAQPAAASAFFSPSRQLLGPVMVQVRAMGSSHGHGAHDDHHHHEDPRDTPPDQQRLFGMEPGTVSWWSDYNWIFVPLLVASGFVVFYMYGKYKRVRVEVEKVRFTLPDGSQHTLWVPIKLFKGEYTPAGMHLIKERENNLTSRQLSIFHRLVDSTVLNLADQFTPALGPKPRLTKDKLGDDFIPVQVAMDRIYGAVPPPLPEEAQAGK